MIAEYGADAVRAYILFMAPPDKDLSPGTRGGLAGIYKFMNRAWRIVNDLVGAAGEESLYQSGATEAEGAEALKTLVRERHRVVRKVVDDFDRNNFNTAIAAIMEACATRRPITCASARPRNARRARRRRRSTPRWPRSS